MYKLNKPIKFGDKTIKEVDLKLDDLTGNDILEVEREVRNLGDTTPSIYLSNTFHAAIVARLIGVPLDVVKTMHANDFSKLTMKVANFFFQ